MIATLVAGVPRRGLVLLLLLLAALVAAPLLVNDYLLTVLILILYFAYAGQAWNIMRDLPGSCRSATRCTSASAPTRRPRCSSISA